MSYFSEFGSALRLYRDQDAEQKAAEQERELNELAERETLAMTEDEVNRALGQAPNLNHQAEAALNRQEAALNRQEAALKRQEAALNHQAEAALNRQAVAAVMQMTDEQVARALGQAINEKNVTVPPERPETPIMFLTPKKAQSLGKGRPFVSGWTMTLFLGPFCKMVDSCNKGRGFGKYKTKMLSQGYGQNIT